MWIKYILTRCCCSLIVFTWVFLSSLPSLRSPKNTINAIKTLSLSGKTPLCQRNNFFVRCVSNCCLGAEHTNKLTREHVFFFSLFFSGMADREVKLMGTGDGRLEKEKLDGTVWDHPTGVRPASTGPESPRHFCRSSFLTNQAALCSTTISLLL